MPNDDRYDEGYRHGFDDGFEDGMLNMRATVAGVIEADAKHIEGHKKNLCGKRGALRVMDRIIERGRQKSLRRRPATVG
jgi:flagellar biosynthesis/type III secretory pathway protein FliH